MNNNSNNFQEELFIDNLIDTNGTIPDYHDTQFINSQLASNVQYYQNNRTIYFLGTNFNWLMDKSIDMKKMYGFDDFFTQPIYFHSSCIRFNDKIALSNPNYKLNKQFKRSKTMIDYFFDILFIFNSEYFIIYLSENTDIHIMTIAYYLLSKYKPCIFIIENINKSVFQYTYRETKSLRKMIYLKAKKNKCPIFFSTDEFLSSFINPFTHQFNIDLLSKVDNDNNSVLEVSTQSISIKYDKMNDDKSKNNMNVFNFNHNIQFLTYTNPIDILNTSNSNTILNNYHRYSLQTKNMKNRLSMDSVFHLLSNWTNITPYMYMYVLPKLSENFINLELNNQTLQEQLNRNQYRVYKKYKYLYKIVPNIKYLDTKFYFDYNYLLPFSKFLLSKSNKKYNIRHYHFFKKYFNNRHPIQRKILGLFNKLDSLNSSLLFQKIYVCHLFNELNESRYFLKNILSIEKLIQTKYYSLENISTFSLSNEFIVLLKFFKHKFFELKKIDTSGKFVYRLNIYDKIPFYDTNNNIELDTSTKYYTFQSSYPKDWIYELIHFYFTKL
jgi:hypothetical protein